MKKGLRIKRNKIWLAATALIVLFVLSSCGRADDETSYDRYIAVICKGSQHEFWNAVEQGAMDAGEELGIRVTFEAPADESQVDVQIDMVKNAIENNADAIVLAPLDVERLNPVIEEAAQQGIPVLTLDSDVTSDKRIATVGTSNENAGAIAARNAVSLMGGEGEIAIVSYVEGAQTAIERNNGFVNEIEENYGGKVKIVALGYSGGDIETAKELTIRFLDEHPDINCIYGTNEGSAMGVAKAVDELGFKDEITVIGFDSSDGEIAYLESGVIDGIMVQNPYNMGYLGVRNMNKVLDGKTIEEKIDTGVTYVNRENLYDEDTQWLLYPFGKEE